MRGGKIKSSGLMYYIGERPLMELLVQMSGRQFDIGVWSSE